MKRSILLILTISLFTSCISTKKYTSFVESKFQNTKAEIESKNENLTFDLSVLKNLSSPVVTTKLKSQFIPAILYWQWNNTMKCEINPQIIGNNFKQNFIRYADSLGLQEKLQERKLEIKVEKIPNSFVYIDKGNAVIFIIAYTIIGSEAILPQEQNLMVSYRVSHHGNIIKKGQINTKNKDQALKNVWKSTKKFTWFYVDQFNINMRSLTKDIAEHIVKEI